MGHRKNSRRRHGVTGASAVSEPAAAPTPAPSLAAAVAAAVCAQMQKLAALEASLGAGDAVESIHDLRVATRRMRAALHLLGQAADPEMQRCRERLAILGKMLGQVRDADVFLAFLNGYTRRASAPDLPALLRLARAERRRRRAHYRTLGAHLASHDYRAWREAFGSQAASWSATEPRTGIPETATAGDTIRACLARVTRYRKRLTRYPAADQHRLRIACKRLRYTAEFFAAPGSGQMHSLVRPMVKMQSALGIAHDAEVDLARVREHLRRLAPAHRDPAARAAHRRLRAVLRERGRTALREAEALQRKFLSRKSQRRIRAQLGRLCP